MQAEYVVGFLFDEDSNHVVLIKKKRPKWQQGKLSGVGGHVKHNESLLRAMQREFHEEAGLDVELWELGVVLATSTWRVHFYFAYGLPFRTRTCTDEEVVVIKVRSLADQANVIGSLKWVIPLCLDPDVLKPVYINEREPKCVLTELIKGVPLHLLEEWLDQKENQ